MSMLYIFREWNFKNTVNVSRGTVSRNFPNNDASLGACYRLQHGRLRVTHTDSVLFSFGIIVSLRPR